MDWSVNASLANEKIMIDNWHMVLGQLHICSGKYILKVIIDALDNYRTRESLNAIHQVNILNLPQHMTLQDSLLR
jgi:hypothetical protein